MMLQHFLIKGSCDVENLITHTATNTQLDSPFWKFFFQARRCFVSQTNWNQRTSDELLVHFDLWALWQPFISNFFGSGRVNWWRRLRLGSCSDFSSRRDFRHQLWTSQARELIINWIYCKIMLKGLHANSFAAVLCRIPVHLDVFTKPEQN